ncbi:hypothetical protein JW758_00495 [Candidatus Peregrinibacteria bacterium]|nr:hypothetical protein [Candidatus Peregrinibacteria bacterium]
MLTSFILSILLIAFAIGVLIALDAITNVGANIVRSILRFTRRSKILTEYILRAYIRYRKTINKQII